MPNEKSIVAIVKDDSLPSNPNDSHEITDWGEPVNKIEKMIEVAISSIYGGSFADKLQEIRGRKRKKEILVVIKPNITAEAEPDQLATTDPRVVMALCRFLKKFNDVKVHVADNSAFGTAGLTRRAFERSKISEAAIRGGADLILPLDEYEYSKVRVKRVSNPLVAQRLHIFAEVDRADYLINLPKMKVIMDELVSLGLKNWQGILRFGGHRPGTEHTIGEQYRLYQQSHHRMDLSQKIVDIHQARKADLTIVDGIWALEGQGPWVGTRRVMNIIIAGEDVVAVDSTACRCIGIDPFEVGAIRCAYKIDLGKMQEDEIEICYHALNEDQADPIQEEDPVHNPYIRQVRKYFRRPSMNPVGVLRRVHLHVGGACQGCLANIRGGMDNLMQSEPSFPFERLKHDVHIICGLDVPLIPPIEGYILVVGDCTAIPIQMSKGICPVLSKDWRKIVGKNSYETYWGCAAVTIFDDLGKFFHRCLRGEVPVAGS